MAFGEQKEFASRKILALTHFQVYGGLLYVNLITYYIYYMPSKKTDIIYYNKDLANHTTKSKWKLRKPANIVIILTLVK